VHKVLPTTDAPKDNCLHVHNTALYFFWDMRPEQDKEQSAMRKVEMQILHPQAGPGVVELYLSCSGMCTLARDSFMIGAHKADGHIKQGQV